MSESTPEPRTAVMILVDASWEDQGGTLIMARVQMENKSASGACLRTKQRINVGTRVHVQWRWDNFSGVVKYCKQEESTYRVGIRRDPKPSTVEPWLERKPETKPEAKPEPKKVLPKAESPRRVDARVREVIRARQPVMPMLPVPAAIEPTSVVQQPAVLPIETVATKVEQPAASSPPVLETKASPETHLPATQLPPGKVAEKERKTMGSKFLNMAGWRKKEEALQGNGNAADSARDDASHAAATPDVTAKSSAHAAMARAVAEKNAADAADLTRKAPENFQVELLPMEDIYRAAGIMNPRRGYSVTKVVEMLHSEHLKGLSKEMKRASVLMALDAAGVSIDDVLRDAKVRQEAIDSYEAQQRRQFETLWAQKAEENMQINAELDRVKASYAEKIKRNQDGVGREKSTFVNWLTTKQQEAQGMNEAVELCTKPRAPAEPTTPEPVANSLPTNDLVGAGTKVV